MTHEKRRIKYETIKLPYLVSGNLIHIFIILYNETIKNTSNIHRNEIQGMKLSKIDEVF